MLEHQGIFFLQNCSTKFVAVNKMKSFFVVNKISLAETKCHKLTKYLSKANYCQDEGTFEFVDVLYYLYDKYIAKLVLEKLERILFLIKHYLKNCIQYIPTECPIYL